MQETESVAEQVLVTPPAVALPVYVVETLGETLVLPDVLGVREPMLLTENVVALLDEYASVDEFPCATVEGVSESVHAGAAVTVTSTESYVVHEV